MAANTISNSVNSLTMIPATRWRCRDRDHGQQMTVETAEARRQLKFLVLVSSAAMLLLSLSLFPLRIGGRLYTRSGNRQSALFVLTTSLIAAATAWSTAFILRAFGVAGIPLHHDYFNRQHVAARIGIGYRSRLSCLGGCRIWRRCTRTGRPVDILYIRMLAGAGCRSR
jgi:hypothetical protein